jgi:hypothetical protein
VMAPFERPLCACGCGARLQGRKLGSRYLNGHHTRTPGFKLQTANRMGMAVPRRCPTCGRVSRVRPYRLATWKGCSQACAAASRRTLKARNPLQQRVLSYLAQERLTLSAFSRHVGLGPTVVAKWVKHENGTTSSATIQRLAVFFQMSYEQALEEAEGVTAEDRKIRDATERMSQYWPKAGTEEARDGARRAGRAKHPPRSAAHTAKLIASHTASGVQQRFAANGAAEKRSIRGRVRASLMAYLMKSRSRTLGDIKRWKQETAARFNLPVGEVHAIWEPHLLKHGLIPPGGRPNEIDYPRVHGWRQEQPAVKWEIIGLRLDRDPEVVRVGYYRWRRGAPQSRRQP